MNIADKIIKLSQPALAKAMRRVLADELKATDIESAFLRAGENYDRLAKDICLEPTFGARVMVQLAAATAGIYYSLVEEGLSEESAIGRTSEINWLLYKKMALPPWKLTWFLSRDPLARVRTAMSLFMIYPYSFPGYDMRWASTDNSTVGFDVYRCPAADYFKGQGLERLCKSAFCDLDYPLADIWGVKLKRPNTLAQGAKFCNFRFLRISQFRGHDNRQFRGHDNRQFRGHDTYLFGFNLRYFRSELFAVRTKPPIR